MARYKDVNTLSPEDASYIAGLIDGEGTISLLRKHRNENRQLVVSISNTETKLLNHVKQVIGAGRITNKRTTKSNHTPSQTFTITNRQALCLLKQIHQYLRTYKADRTKLILEKYIRLTPRNGKYSTSQLKERDAFINEVLNLKTH